MTSYDFNKPNEIPCHDGAVTTIDWRAALASAETPHLEAHEVISIRIQGIEQRPSIHGIDLDGLEEGLGQRSSAEAWCGSVDSPELILGIVSYLVADDLT